mmetsp:Transcript_2985/g.4591  ORF Transcript_2985/g.4591 Transcript_2985/m.4591 type:complete len:122 (+) Transcript_2985:77-442(+)
MLSSKVSITILIALVSMEKISAFCSPRQTTTPTFLRYTVFGGIDDEEPEKDPWAVGSNSSSLKQQKTETQTKVVGHGPGDLSGYNDEFVEEEVADLNVDAYDSEAGQIMPGFHLSSLCGDD